MKEVEKNELLNTIGGGVTGTLINAFNGIVKTIYTFGQTFGSAMRRLTTKKVCSCK